MSMFLLMFLLIGYKKMNFQHESLSMIGILGLNFIITFELCVTTRYQSITNVAAPLLSQYHKLLRS